MLFDYGVDISTEETHINSIRNINHHGTLTQVLGLNGTFNRQLDFEEHGVAIKSHANVIAFGKALSKAGDQTEYTDWHGAGAQRSSIKSLADTALTEEDTCSVNACDVDRPDNLVRCVRLGS